MGWRHRSLLFLHKTQLILVQCRDDFMIWVLTRCQVHLWEDFVFPSSSIKACGPLWRVSRCLRAPTLMNQHHQTSQMLYFLFAFVITRKNFRVDHCPLLPFFSNSSSRLHLVCCIRVKLRRPKAELLNVQVIVLV